MSPTLIPLLFPLAVAKEAGGGFVRGAKSTHPPSLHKLQGPPLIWYNFKFSLEAELFKLFHPQAEVPTTSRR